MNQYQGYEITVVVVQPNTYNSNLVPALTAWPVETNHLPKPGRK